MIFRAVNCCRSQGLKQSRGTVISSSLGTIGWWSSRVSPTPIRGVPYLGDFPSHLLSIITATSSISESSRAEGTESTCSSTSFSLPKASSATNDHALHIMVSNSLATYKMLLQAGDVTARTDMATVIALVIVPTAHHGAMLPPNTLTTGLLRSNP
ncbi:hypothetical protein Taro_007415 [Colocasia esculenta]|uniref:Uncharacterized protein n=1 Tax=Colocasia esculenta TaxID=4460 RepID=A0A843TYW5_COLES|nr:hypothetical protein [Colocasia esculenta]